MTRPVCPSCATEVIKPFGYTNSDILIIGDAPGKKELQKGKPYVGPTGNVLRQEMKRVGINLYNCRISNLWLHAPNGNENCMDVGKNVALEEAKGRKAILLIGAIPVEYFTGYKVSEVSGLEVDVNMFSTQIVYAMYQPAIVFQGLGVGEIRFALESFANRLREENIL